MKKTKAKVAKKPKEKLDVSFWSLILKLTLVFVILASIAGVVVLAVFPIHFSFNPYKNAFKLSDQTARTWFKTSLGSNITFKASTYKQSGLFLTKAEQEQIVTSFNNGTDISRTEDVEQLASFLGLEYVDNNLMYQDQIVNSALRLLPIITDSSKSELDGEYSYGDVTLTKENDSVYTAVVHHIYIVYLEILDVKGKNDNKIKVNLKKYVTFDQTQENITFNELFKLVDLPFGGTDDEIINQIYLVFSANASAQNGSIVRFDSTKIKQANQIKDFFKLDTSDSQKAKLWNQLNNLQISINIVPGSEEIDGMSGDKLISTNYEADEQGKSPTNHNYQFKYRFEFEVNGKRKIYNYKFIPDQIIKPPPPPST